MFQTKQIFKQSELKKILTEENSCVSLVPTRRLLALHPRFLNDIKTGIFCMLNNALKKYDQTLDGILIGYQNVKILMDDRTGLIPMGVAEIRVNISVEFYLFRPKIGGTLQGVVNKKSNSHVGCLIHKYFNATILKPEDVEYDAWEGKSFNINDKITLKVKDLDFTDVLPRIEGCVYNSELAVSDSNAVNSETNFKNIHNEYDYERKLLESEDFWKTKLNKRKRTESSDEAECDLEGSIQVKDVSDMNEKNNVASSSDNPYPKKKKRKKDRDSLEMAINKVIQKSLEEKFKVNNATEEDEIVTNKINETDVNSSKDKELIPNNKIEECDSKDTEENVFSSTVLEPSNKLNIDFCSPISVCKENKVVNKSEKQKNDSERKKNKLKKRKNSLDLEKNVFLLLQKQLVNCNKARCDTDVVDSEKLSTSKTETAQADIHHKPSKRLKLEQEKSYSEVSETKSDSKKHKKKELKKEKSSNEESVSFLYSKLLDDALKSINVSDDDIKTSEKVNSSEKLHKGRSKVSGDSNKKEHKKREKRSSISKSKSSDESEKTFKKKNKKIKKNKKSKKSKKNEECDRSLPSTAGDLLKNLIKEMKKSKEKKKKKKKKREK